MTSASWAFEHTPDILHGQTGYEEVEVNNRGRVIRQLKRCRREYGRDIYLTLDLSSSSILKRCWQAVARQ